MANTDLLTEDYEEIPGTPEHLKVEACLGEFNESLKATARLNLGIPPNELIVSPTAMNIAIAESISKAFAKYLELDDPPITLEVAEKLISEALLDYVSKSELSDFLLPAYDFASSKVRNHLLAEDPHLTLAKTLDLLQQHPKYNEVYLKLQLYTKKDIDDINGAFVKLDGTTPFRKPLIGVDPIIDSHLSTKRYVDDKLYEHLVSIDPHGFVTLLNTRLTAYCKKKDYFDKTQTYSRTLIDSIIRLAVEETTTEMMQDYVDLINDKFEYIRKLNYVKLDGSTPFRNTQKGIDAVEPNDLVTLQLVDEKVNTVLAELILRIDSKECIWKTSGPVESTVGHVEDNTPVPENMTLLEIMDAIFYGKGICLEVPDFVIITEKCPVTLCIHGSTGLIQNAELYLNGELIYTFKGEDFKDGCITVDSLPLYDDAEFKFKVYYTNGAIHEETKIVNCYMPIFVGLLPKWEFGNTVSMDRLIELCKEDEAGTLNRFLNYGKDLKTFTFKYLFQDPKLRHPFIVLPESYPDLDTMVTKSQSFGIEAFDVINRIPLSVPGVEKDIIFKMYIYRQALSSLNQEVTFNFKPKE